MLRNETQTVVPSSIILRELDFLIDGRRIELRFFPGLSNFCCFFIRELINRFSAIFLGASTAWCAQEKGEKNQELRLPPSLPTTNLRKEKQRDTHSPLRVFREETDRERHREAGT